MAGKMGCTWALTDSRYPNGGSFPLSPNPDVRPDSAVIASTLYSQDYITLFLAINPNVTESDLRARMAEGNFPFGYMPPKPVS